MLCSLVYTNHDENISLKGSENKVENGKSTNEISHISNLRYVITEQTLTQIAHLNDVAYKADAHKNIHVYILE